jgi:hypothetical protein
MGCKKEEPSKDGDQIPKIKLITFDLAVKLFGVYCLYNLPKV